MLAKPAQPQTDAFFHATNLFPIQIQKDFPSQALLFDFHACHLSARAVPEAAHERDKAGGWACFSQEGVLRQL